MKKQLIWWTVFALLSTLIIGIITRFKFNRLDIQIYDTYYVIESIHGIILLTLVLGLGRYIFLFINRLIQKLIN